MTGDDFRELALGLDGVVELSHLKHPDFRVNGRVFATLNGDESGGGVGLPPAERISSWKNTRRRFLMTKAVERSLSKT